MNKKYNCTTNYSYVISCIFLLFYQTVSSQNNDNVKSIINLKISTEKRINKIDSLLHLKEDTLCDSLHLYYQDYAFWLFDIDKIEKAIFYENKALDYEKSKVVSDSLFVQKGFLILGFFHNQNSQILRSIDVFNKAFEYGKSTSYKVKIYEQLGFSYKDINDYYKALSHFELAISLLNKEKKKEIKRLRNLYFNAANVCLRIKAKNSFQKAIKYAKATDSLSKIIPTSNRVKYKIKKQLATCYNQNETLDIDLSLGFYREALAIAKHEKDRKKISNIYRMIGNLYNTTNQEKALEFLNKALSLASKSDNFQLYKIYYNFNLAYSLKGDYEESIKYGHKSLECLIGNDFMNIDTINYNLLIDTKHKKRLLLIFPNLGETYLRYYEEKKDPLLLKKSIAYFKLADYVIDLLKINSDEFKSKLFWRKLSTDIYGKAIRACYLNNNATDAFYFMEKNKALLLMEDIATQNYRQSLKVSTLSLEKEKQLKRVIFSVKNTIENYHTTKNSTLDSLKKVLLDSNRNLLRLQDSIYGTKQLMKTHPKIVTLQEVQQHCKTTEVKIEYHISIDDGYGIYSNNENGYVLFITKDKHYFFEIPNQSLLKENSSNLINALKLPFTTEEDIKNYTKTAYTIFNTLFPTHEIKELITSKKLTIVPDSYLALLPFEALNTKENTLNYLINESETSYLYSYSFLSNQDVKQEKNTKFLGVAPSTFNYDGLLPLEHSEKEIVTLGTYYKGSILINEKATKNEFLKQLSKYNIIHLATHANAQDAVNPWIAFSDKKLLLEELYLTQNNASLVVLSGCNTTLGKEEIGEGIMSLARGFFYSGSQSVVSSLWSVDNTSTPVIMNAFYKNLHDGQTKSEALHNAKLSYLKSHSFSEASPHYWASFIMLGQDNGIDQPSTIKMYLLYVFIGLLLLFVIYKVMIKRNYRSVR